MDMDGSLGYEYHYSFSMDEEIIPQYEFKQYPGVKSFLFDIRTSFIVKQRRHEDEVIIISQERWDACLPETGPIDIGIRELDRNMMFRLDDYWMCPRQAYTFAYYAVAFAKKIADDPSHVSLRVIPVVVDLNVCTLQQEDEPLTATMERSISAERLIPLHLCPSTTAYKKRLTRSDVDCRLSKILPRFLSTSFRFKVEKVDEEASALMEVCHICSRRTSIGTYITKLWCGHAFHSHCLLPTLEKSFCCPLCQNIRQKFPKPLDLNPPKLEITEEKTSRVKRLVEEDPTSHAEADQRVRQGLYYVLESLQKGFATWSTGDGVPSCSHAANRDLAPRLGNVHLDDGA